MAKIPREPVENQITTLSLVKIAIEFSLCTIRENDCFTFKKLGFFKKWKIEVLSLKLRRLVKFRDIYYILFQAWFFFKFRTPFAFLIHSIDD